MYAGLPDAIAACVAAGGGRVAVPPGRWLAGAIRLASRVDLHVEAGATILFSIDAAHYPIVATRFEGVVLMNYSPLIYASDPQDVAITGRGTIDGRGMDLPRLIGEAFAQRDTVRSNCAGLV